MNKTCSLKDRNDLMDNQSKIDHRSGSIVCLHMIFFLLYTFSSSESYLSYHILYLGMAYQLFPNIITIKFLFKINYSK